MKAALDPQARRMLRALYELAELDAPADVGVLARVLALSPSHAARILCELDARGLVDASRARLTMLGLASAARVRPLGLAGLSNLSAPVARDRKQRLNVS